MFVRRFILLSGLGAGGWEVIALYGDRSMSFGTTGCFECSNLLDLSGWSNGMESV